MNKLLVILQLILIIPSIFSQAPPANRGEGTMAFSNFWSSPQGADGPKKELASLLSPMVSPSDRLTGSKDVPIYGNVHFLMPLEEAKAALGLPSRPAPRAGIVAPGFPKDSLVAYAFDAPNGIYNKLYLITDRADQVVSILLMAEKPPQVYLQSGNATGNRVYNFVMGKVSASTNIKVYQSGKYIRQILSRDTLKVTPESASTVGTVVDEKQKRDIAIVVIDAYAKTVAGTNRSTKPTTNVDVIEVTKWYIPRPLAEVLLYCSLR